MSGENKIEIIKLESFERYVTLVVNYGDGSLGSFNVYCCFFIRFGMKDRATTSKFLSRSISLLSFVILQSQ